MKGLYTRVQCNYSRVRREEHEEEKRRAKANAVARRRQLGAAVSERKDTFTGWYPSARRREHGRRGDDVRWQEAKKRGNYGMESGRFRTKWNVREELVIGPDLCTGRVPPNNEDMAQACEGLCLTCAT